MSFFVLKKEKMFISALMVLTLMVLGYYVQGNLTQPVDVVPTEATADKDKAKDENNKEEKKDGQVILYNSQDDAFIEYRLSRDYERAQLLDELRVVMAGVNVSPEEVAKAKSLYDQVIDVANIEDELEEKIMELGYEDCVYLQVGERAQVILRAEKISTEQYLQIIDTIGEFTGLSHDNIEVSYIKPN
ncbi:hypothetical protein BHU72_02335 [Desulfuribacillus stibiiarsenatis]|uniref:Stage III sporulation protein AH n=1 Tax=Desulfuribacillus stibiiarsenatis TaxID=1390249 RepID=A0A1E5L6B5_9FIRM|nr:SpoIIIAH-like family protein [Desulfuribacillus stibiiarsenatis]OEH85656.1 hypothetical protein BHU72_02335 [Desulfuribacillus stibiiarsenatis]